MSTEQKISDKIGTTSGLFTSLLGGVDPHNITNRFIQPHIDELKHNVKPYIYLHAILQIVIIILLILILVKISKK
jgi:hypothetical protein